MQDLNYNIETLNDFVRKTIDDHIVVTHRNIEGYAGMVMYIGIKFNIEKAKYELNLEWMSLGLDLYGDTLQESYHYQFDSLEKLLDYLLIKYNIKVTDIPIKYQFEKDQFPDPIYYKEQKHEFEVTWKKFQQDFKNDAFLDPLLKLVYSSC